MNLYALLCNRNDPEGFNPMWIFTQAPSCPEESVVISDFVNKHSKCGECSELELSCEPSGFKLKNNCGFGFCFSGFFNTLSNIFFDMDYGICFGVSVDSQKQIRNSMKFHISCRTPWKGVVDKYLIRRWEKKNHWEYWDD